MAIPAYEDWMKYTGDGIPIRSKEYFSRYPELINVDRALQFYHQSKNMADQVIFNRLLDLERAFTKWIETKKDFNAVHGEDDDSMSKIIALNMFQEIDKKLEKYNKKLPGYLKAKLDEAMRKVQREGNSYSQISAIIARDFEKWTLTNFGERYRQLLKPGTRERSAEPNVKIQDGMMMMSCNAVAGRRKSTDEVNSVGARIFRNGGGCCTTSAFAAAHKLLEGNIKDRIEIIAQGPKNGHMWVVVGRSGGSYLDGKVWRPAHSHRKWGNFIVVDTWLMAFGWEGVWHTPKEGIHHGFISNDRRVLEIAYDSWLPNGD